MSLKYLGLLAVITLFGGAAFIVWKWPQGKHRTLSQHVAIDTYKVWYYILLFSIVLALLLPFFFYWFMPTFGLSVWFGILIAVAAVFQYACTLIPEVGGWKTKYHRLFAGISGACFVPALFLVLTANAVPMAGKIVAGLSLAVMIAIIVLLMRGRGEHSHFLILQFCYFGAFFIPILLITYM